MSQDYPEIDLIPLDLGLLQLLMEDPEQTLEQFCSNSDEVGETVAQVAAATIRFMGTRTVRAPWVSYLGQRGDDHAIVGVCSFKSEPDEEAEVEIAYFTFAGYEGQGVATAMAGALVATAAASEEARRVIAHTMDDEGPSARLLRGLGFENEGMVIDPEDGAVHRWVLSL
ncbi:GNAT family N-acetyltransferase [Lacibacterium aquatile]|uniref:GNAT family N-acetyltransferase n=1 Tax=Lacibacterium aquatile TaxID=1168082 RepID=A0ABW5DQ03_9PROT